MSACAAKLQGLRWSLYPDHVIAVGLSGKTLVSVSIITLIVSSKMRLICFYGLCIAAVTAGNGTGCQQRIK